MAKKSMRPEFAVMHQSRVAAMQILFLWDSRGQYDDAVALTAAEQLLADPAARSKAMEMARLAWEQKAASDAWVNRLAPQWPTHRQPGVDRNIIRLAVWELTSGTMEPKVVLDEAIELAKEFGGEQSAPFVNGVMDAIFKEHSRLTGGALPAQT